MAYRLKRGESVMEGVKRIARQEIESSVQYLRGKGGVTTETAVHETRKSIKKTRAVLRLVRPGLGEIYASTNARLQQSGHELSELRDAGALIVTFDNLRKNDKKLTGSSLAPIRHVLVLHKKHLEEEYRAQKIFEKIVEDRKS